MVGRRTSEEQSTGGSAVAHGHSRKKHPLKLSRLVFHHRAYTLGQRLGQARESDILADGSWFEVDRWSATRRIMRVRDDAGQTSTASVVVRKG